MKIKNLRSHLHAVLRQRQLNNPSYSMRAFAKFLELDPSRLKKILDGTRPINDSLIEFIGKKLELDQSNIDRLIFSYRLKKNPELIKEIELTSEYLEIKQDIFEIISDWRHYGVLELLKLPQFEPSFPWIASVLNCELSEVCQIIARLERSELLLITNENKWIDTSKGFSTHIISPLVTTKAHRQYQKDLLELSIKSLEEVPMNLRDNSSMMMATSGEKIIQAKEMIKDFRRRLCEFLEDTDEKDSIYQLGVVLYPLTSNTKNSQGQAC